MARPLLPDPPGVRAVAAGPSVPETPLRGADADDVAAPAAPTETPEPPARAGELHLALFLLLTGFFAVLLALAEPEPDRARMVLESLADTFTGPLAPAAPAAENGARGAEPTSRARRDRLPLGEPLTAAERRAGLLARVRLADDRLFDSSGRIPRWRWFLLGRLARRIADGPGSDARLEILVPADLRSDPGVAVRRLETLLARLGALGAPRDRLAVGLLPGVEGRWTFLLRQQAAGDGT